MKRTIIIFSFLLLFAVSLFGQNNDSVSNKQEIQRLNNEISQLSSQKKYAELLPLAKRLVELSELELGENSIETGKAIHSLGYVYFLLDKKDEAEKNLERAIQIYGNSQDKETEKLKVFALETLAFIKYKKDKYSESQKLLSSATIIREKINGAQSKEVIANLWSMANLSYTDGDFSSAVELYRRVLEAKIKDASVSKIDASDAFVRCRCSLYKVERFSEAIKLKQKYYEEVIKRDKIKEEDVVINGKAIKLPKPDYPAQLISKKVYITGEVDVLVVINEKGEVVFACAHSGNKVFHSVVEKAAYKARFEPAKVNGEPIKVIGTIIYKFTK